MIKFIYFFVLTFLTTSLLATPDFLIIGVAKSGTTSLFDYLVKHPKILGAKKRTVISLCAKI